MEGFGAACASRLVIGLLMLEEGWMPEDLDNKTFDVIWSGQIQTFQGLVGPSHSWVLGVWHQKGAWGLAGLCDDSLLAPRWKSWRRARIITSVGTAWMDLSTPGHLMSQKLAGFHKVCLYHSVRGFKGLQCARFHFFIHDVRQWYWFYMLNLKRFEQLAGQTPIE